MLMEIHRMWGLWFTKEGFHSWQISSSWQPNPKKRIAEDLCLLASGDTKTSRTSPYGSLFITTVGVCLFISRHISPTPRKKPEISQNLSTDWCVYYAIYRNKTAVQSQASRHQKKVQLSPPTMEIRKIPRQPPQQVQLTTWIRSLRQAAAFVLHEHAVKHAVWGHWLGGPKKGDHVCSKENIWFKNLYTPETSMGSWKSHLVLKQKTSSKPPYFWVPC